jgi:selT/selW/selH-like putative selenoprotein
VRELLRARGIEDVEHKPGRSGQFDVIVDGKLRYSKFDSGRFPSEQEIEKLLAGG